MRLLALILLFCSLSIEATEEYCGYINIFYDLCETGNVITSVIERWLPISRPRSLEFRLYENRTVKPYLFKNTKMKHLHMECSFNLSEEHQTIYTLSLAPASLASSTLTSLYLKNINLALTEGKLIGLDSVSKLTIVNSWTDRLSTELFPFLPNLEELFLNWHRLSVIPAQSFAALKKLKHLELKGDQQRKPYVFTTLELGCFNGLENLETLEITKIAMNYVPPVFDGLSKLKSLTIRTHRRIKTINGSIFRNLSKLTHLDLSRNNLKSLEPGTFDGLSRLTEINLRSNKLNAIPKGLFNNLTALKTINLGSNRILIIETNAFSGLNLTQITLFSAIVPGGQIQPGAFNNLTVNELNIIRNQNFTITPKSFNGLSATTVNLKHNNLSKIRSDDFFGLKTINLDLSLNQIAEIEPLAFKNTEVEFINLKDNNDVRGNKRMWGLPETVKIVL